MGSCVSLRKNSGSGVGLSSTTLQSKNENLSESKPVKQNSVAANGQDHSVAAFAVKSQRSLPCSRDDGSKDDAFYESQPWLESDCEDDFRSVNGDFTPSRGSTPVHHRFSSGNPTVNKPPSVGGTIGSVPEPSPKKRLSELFQDSLRRNQDGEEGESSDGSVVIENGARNEKSCNGVVKEEEKSVQCCLPRLRSSSGRKNKMRLPNGS